MIVHGKKTITITPDRIIDRHLPQARFVTFRAEAANNVDIFIGDFSIQAENGFLLKPGERLEIEIKDTQELHAITSTGTAEIFWMVTD